MKNYNEKEFQEIIETMWAAAFEWLAAFENQQKQEDDQNE